MARHANPGLTAQKSKRDKHPVSQAPAETGSYPVIRNVCVYCGSAAGADPLYEEAARLFGQILATSGVGLIYGGGNKGLMGALARATREHGGHVTGIIPEFLTGRNQLSEFVTTGGDAAAEELQKHVIVGDMHTRKRLMFERADAFVALPGGIGTLEELTEQLTWLQLERHTKPVVIANIAGFWRPLLALFAHMREQRFIQPEFEVRYLVAEAVEDILPMMQATAERHARLGVKKTEIDPRL